MEKKMKEIRNIFDKKEFFLKNQQVDKIIESN